MLIITTLRGIDLHPELLFLAAAFISFHLLLAYLVDHVSIHASFAISSAVSIFLVVTYLRLVVGIGFASREAAAAQFIYLVMFSYAFFLKGFTGLAIAIGSILTLFVVMQVTGRIRWNRKIYSKESRTYDGTWLIAYSKENIHRLHRLHRLRTRPAELRRSDHST